MISNKPNPVPPRTRPRLCASCGFEIPNACAFWPRSRLCAECVAPLDNLDFPEHYCDLGEGD